MKNKKLFFLLYSVVTFLFVFHALADVVESNTVNTVEDLIQAIPFKPQEVLIVFDVDNTILVCDLSNTQAVSVESGGVPLILSLQNRGFQVVALTARTSNWASFTKQQFASLGIDLTKNNPKNETVKLSRSSASYDDGILLCGVRSNGESAKGLVLNDFLNATDNKCRCIISVDDQIVNLIAEEEAAVKRNIEFRGVYYQGFENLAQSYVNWFEALFQPKTPTGAIIRDVHREGALKKEMAKFWGTRAYRFIKDSNFNDMMRTIAMRENCFCNADVDGLNTHSVFYSSVPPFVAYLQDILSVFYSVFHDKKLCDLVPLRIGYDDFKNIRSAKEFCAYNDETDKMEIAAKTWKGSWDGRSIMRKTCLSANSSLFEDIDVGNYSESALDYFLYPRLNGGACAFYPGQELSLKTMLYEAFAFFGIEKFFEPFGLQLINSVSATAGANPINAYFDNNNSSRMLQIFIPREYVDQSVYFCVGGGNAYQTDKSASTTCELLKRGVDPQLNFSLPSGYLAGAPYRQVRIFLQPLLFLDPTKGFKIFKYDKNFSGKTFEPGYFSELYRIASDIKMHKDGKELDHKVKVEDRLTALLENFKRYKTWNTGFHSGDLYEHSIWVGNVIKAWGSEVGNVWCEGLDVADIKCAYLAAILHDVGKAGDLVFQYFDKPTHPNDGFLYITGKKTYWMDPETSFNFTEMFKKLGVDESAQKVIAILVGIHGDLGKNIMRDGVSPENFSSYISRISELCMDVDYNGGSCDKKLLKLAILLSAADIKGAQQVEDNGEVYFGIESCSCLPTHHSGESQFDLLGFAAKGIRTRQALLEFFDKPGMPVSDNSVENGVQISN